MLIHITELKKLLKQAYMEGYSQRQQEKIKHEPCRINSAWRKSEVKSIIDKH
jgi:hypothetical protein